MATNLVKNILFVDHTDTSLAPLVASMAAVELRGLSTKTPFEFSSAGSHAGLNTRPVERRVAKMAAARNIDLSDHRSTQLVREICDRADVIITMKEENFWFVKDISPEISSHSLRMLMEYSDQLGLREMPDPLFGEIKFEKAFEILERLSKKIVEKMTIKLE